MPSATDVNLGYGVLSPIYRSKAKKWHYLENLIFLKIRIFGNYEFWKIIKCWKIK